MTTTVQIATFLDDLPYIELLSTFTGRNIVDNFLQVVIYLALVANIKNETWKKNVLQVNCYTFC